MKKILLIFVTYYPKSKFIDILNSISNEYDVAVFNNSGLIEELSNKIIQFDFKKNYGLGYALNFLCNKYKNKYKYALYFDQDTYFTTETLKYIDEKIKITSPTDCVGIYNFSHKDKNIEFSSKDLVINSGSVYDLEILNKIGFHNSNIFMDCLDYDLCINCHLHEIKIIQYYNTPFLDHINHQSEHLYSLFGKKFNLYRKYEIKRQKEVLAQGARLAFICLINFRIKLFLKMIFFIFSYIFFQVLTLVRK